MADLKLSIDVSDAIKATQTLRKVESNIRQLSARVASGSITQNTYNEGLRQQNSILRKTGVSVSKATTMIHSYANSLLEAKSAQDKAADMSQWFAAQRRRMQMMKESERIAAQQTKEEERVRTNYERLRATLDSNYAARMRLRQASQTLRAAVDAEIISVQEAAAMLRQYNAVANSASVAATDLARRMNRKGVITQQAGYQLGDFIVQVQSGTNWMVAFGQQATQVAGTLTLLKGKWLLIGSVLGVAIPLLTAVGAAIMRTRQEAEETADEVQTLSEVISSLNTIQRTVARDFESNLNKAFEESASAVGELVRSLRELEFSSLRQPINELVNSLSQADRVGVALDTILAFDEQIKAGKQLSVVQQGVLDDAKSLVEENLVLAIAVGDVQKALSNITTAGNTKELIESFAKANSLLSQMSGPLADEMKAALLDAAKEAGLLEEVLSFAEDAANDTAEGISKITERANEAARAAFGIFQALRNASMAMSATEAGIAAAQRTSSRGGSEMQIRAIQAAAAEEARLTALGVSGSELQASVAAAFSNEMRRLQADAAEQSLYSRFDSKGGGGRSGATGFASRVFGAELQRAIEQAQEDLRLYNQEVKMLDSALQAGLVTQQEYNSFVAQAREAYNQAQQGAYDYASAMEQVEKTAMSSMENAFMSIIDGSKSAGDAFRDMARQILAEAMRMLVIRPLINSLFGGIGGGLSKGIPGKIGKASGGTMMAGKPYLVGEHGPELVIPGRSGTVMNADLTGKAMGGSSGVIVNNNITVTGGTDPAAIRMEVAKLMPQITNATKTAVIDARRRGGQMKAAFQ